jgi:hypothetical protein
MCREIRGLSASAGNPFLSTVLFVGRCAIGDEKNSKRVGKFLARHRSFLNFCDGIVPLYLCTFSADRVEKFKLLCCGKCIMLISGSIRRLVYLSLNRLPMKNT